MKKIIVISLMLSLFVFGLACSKLASIAEYQKVVAEDAKYMTDFEKATNKMSEISDPAELQKIIKEEAIPALEKSEKNLKGADLPDEELKAIHNLIIDARTKTKDALAEYTKDLTSENMADKAGVYLKKLEEVTKLENEYTTKMQEYYGKLGMQTES